MVLAVEKQKSRIAETHSLQLYSSGIDKYSIHSFFLSGAAGAKAFYVTHEDKQTAAALLAEYGVSNATILSPAELNVLEKEDGARVLVDCSSFEDVYALDKKIIGIKKNEVLCTYDTSKLKPDEIKKLVELHDRLVLSTPESTVLSYHSLHKLSKETVEKVIKNELETIVLALVNGKPMTGMDIIKFLHKEFDVMVSPGRIYPALHEMEERGLLTCEYGIRNKVYKVKNSEQVNQKLAHHVHISRYLSKFVESKAR